MTKYYLEGEEFGRTIVDVKITPKTFTITPLEEQPFGCWGCLDQLWRNGKIVVKEPKRGMCKHKLIDWEDGSYTIYPDRAGLPYLLTKVEDDRNQ